MTRKYDTLGDVAEELKVMLADGVSLGSIEYALDRVYWKEYEQRRETVRVFKELGGIK